MTCCSVNVVIMLLALASKCTTSGIHDAKRLYDDLLRKSGYNKLVRPVANHSEKLTVRMGIKLSQIVDVVSGLARIFYV